MIIVDKALEKLARDKTPIRVALFGLGFIGRGIMGMRVPGIEIVAVGSRHTGVRACALPEVDVVVDATGDVEYGAQIATAAFASHKHLVLMNAELDATLGPILKAKADEAGVIYTASDGDQPGVIMNLYRTVKGLGFRPVLCGNIKSYQDVRANPNTIATFATKYRQKPSMITSFTDGTKISIEQAIVANGTGMRVSVRGMYGPTVSAGTPIQGAAAWYPVCDGVVDYVIGAAPAPGVFVIGEMTDVVQRQYLEYYKMGAGPQYVFHTPQHLCHFEVHNSVARAALFNDATLAPIGAPMVDVIARIKIDLKRGMVLDGIGGFDLYGQCENSPVVREERLLPIGLAKDCILKRDVPQDMYLTYDDVEIPSGRLSDRLRGEQNDRWGK